ncbi:hypothetical protein I5E63_15050 [Pseudomonas aeruginosa]|nr:hypothetical protein [Pseudomonas aeruginosa]
MIAILSEGVISAISKTPEVLKLHKLLWFASEGRHALIPESDKEISGWLNTLDQPTRSAYEQALALSARTIATLPNDIATVKITSSRAAIWRHPLAELGIDDAIKLLEEPLGILLENAKNDWHFLKRIMRSPERTRLQRAIDARWAEPLHGGGSDITQRLSERTSTEPKRLRTFVLFDSDRRHPDELHPDWAPQPPEACQGFKTEIAVAHSGIGGYWRLNRRFIESYLPRQELVKAAPAKADSISALFRLHQYGQWYFNIKKGFKDDAKIENAHRAKDLYANITHQDAQLLEDGIGSRIANQYSTSDTIEFDWDSEARQEALSAVPQLIRLL